MKYKILSLPDIHWGAIGYEKLWKMLLFILYTVDQMDNLDLLVLNGDYWDSKLPLDSKDAIYGTDWFYELLRIAKKNGVQKIRMIKGTEDHDHSELEHFRHLENDGTDWFRLFNTTTSEETLPGLRCIYCPDETITTEQYNERYIHHMMNNNQIAFIHGNFDVVFSESHISNHARKNVLYELNLWQSIINGPIIAGHWHSPKQYGHLYYGGSPYTWKYGEENGKGIDVISYDTDNSSYAIFKIRNPYATDYLTFDLYSNVIFDTDQMLHLTKPIDLTLQSYESSLNDVQIRIRIHLTDEKKENDILVTTLTQYYQKYPNVSVKIKDKLKEKKKKQEREYSQKLNEEYSFIEKKNTSEIDILHEFIQKEYQKEIPIEFIRDKFSKYIS